jgi:hypothetical protein
MVCSYRPAEIVRIRARFQLPLQLGPNEKKTKKSRQGKQKKEGKVEGFNDNDKRTGG